MGTDISQVPFSSVPEMSFPTPDELQLSSSQSFGVNIVAWIGTPTGKLEVLTPILNINDSPIVRLVFPKLEMDIDAEAGGAGGAGSTPFTTIFCGWV
jgi:hypothetical protein